MPSSYTSSLRLTLPATGELNGTWGTTVNTGITQLVDTAVAGYVSIAMSDADYTLSAANGATDEARNMFVDMTGTLTAARNVICPTAEKLYFFKNSTTGGYALTLKTSGGTGISVPNGKSMVLMCDGTNVIDATSHMSSLTLASALPVASGGTGATSLTANNVLLGNGTSAVQAVAPGTSGNVLTSNGSTWQSTTPSVVERDFGALGTKQVATTTASTAVNAVCSLSATRAFRLRRNASSLLFVDLIDETGVVLGSANASFATAANATNPGIVALDSSTAVVGWQEGTTTLIVQVTYSGSTVTVGTHFQVDNTAPPSTSAAITVFKFSATKVAIVYCVSSVTRYRVFTPGSTMTAVAAAAQLSSTGYSTLLRSAGGSATQAVVFGMATNQEVAVCFLVTESLGAFTLAQTTIFQSAVTEISAGFDLVPTGTANEYLAVFGAVAGGTPDGGLCGRAFTFQVSGTGSAAVRVDGPVTNMPLAGAIGEHALAQADSSTYVLATTTPTGTNVVAYGLRVSNGYVTVPAGASMSTGNISGSFDVAVCGSNALLAYADPSNSNYPTTVPISLGTLTA